MTGRHVAPFTLHGIQLEAAARRAHQLGFIIVAKRGRHS